MNMFSKNRKYPNAEFHVIGALETSPSAISEDELHASSLQYNLNLV